MNRVPSKSLSFLVHSILALASAVAAGAAGAGTLSGRVADSSGTKSLQGAEVELLEIGRRTQTGADGEFRFSDVPDGTYTLRTRYVGAIPIEQKAIVEGRTDGVNVRLGGSDDIDNILVVGQRASLSSSLSRQRAADGIESVLSRDGIGQFPDQNAAEALRRVSGVNVLNDQGEGRFVAVRGLSPDLNAISINGSRVPAPEADVRSVALDVIPAELIESIEVKKSLTPDMDADTIGASIEINTTSAFDRTKPYLSFSGEGSYNDLNQEWSPKGSVDFSTTLGERLGVAGGVAYYRREFSTDNIEMEGWDERDGIAYADTLEYRDYDVERTRLGGSLSLDFRASDSTTLYARFLRSRFEDQEYRGRLAFEMEEAPRGGTADTAYFSAEDGEIQIVRDIKDRYEEQTISSLNIGGDTFVGPWTMRYGAAWSKAREREAGSLDPVEFQQEFEGPDTFEVTFDYSDRVLPRYVVNADPQRAFNDPTAFEFDEIERTSLSNSEDEERSARFDIARDLRLTDSQLTLQVGAKARERKKTYDLELDVYDGFDGELTLADVLAAPTYGLYDVGFVPSGPAMRRFYADNQAGFELNALDTQFESSVADYAVEEDIYAGYALARYERGGLRLIGGARLEQTRNDIAGNIVELIEEGGEYGGEIVDEDTVYVSRARFERDYTDVLPSLNVRYQTDADVLYRVGAYRSLVRPNIGQLAPRFLVEQDDEGEREGEFGNPDLKPYEAWNVDLSAEWYFAGNGVLQAGAFYKTIDNFIVDAEFEAISFNGIYADEAVIPINGDEAEVRGLELNYQQALDFLPAPLDGFLLGFNYTYTNSEGSVSGRTIPLPAAAKNTFNLTLGYEKGPLSLRATAAYRDSYLDELGPSQEEDRYVEDHIQYDLSAKYRLTQQFQLFAEFVNLGDEPYVAYQPGAGRKRLLQYEEYSWTGKMGFRMNF